MAQLLNMVTGGSCCQVLFVDPFDLFEHLVSFHCCVACIFVILRCSGPFIIAVCFKQIFEAKRRQGDVAYCLRKTARLHCLSVGIPPKLEEPVWKEHKRNCDTVVT